MIIIGSNKVKVDSLPYSQYLDYVVETGTILQTAIKRYISAEICAGVYVDIDLKATLVLSDKVLEKITWYTDEIDLCARLQELYLASTKLPEGWESEVIDALKDSQPLHSIEETIETEEEIQEEETQEEEIQEEEAQEEEIQEEETQEEEIQEEEAQEEEIQEEEAQEEEIQEEETQEEEIQEEETQEEEIQEEETQEEEIQEEETQEEEIREGGKVSTQETRVGCVNDLTTQWELQYREVQTKLEQVLEEFNGVDMQIKDLQTTVEQKETLVVEKQKEVERLCSEVKELTQELEKLNSENCELRKDIADKTQKIQELNVLVSQLQHQLEVERQQTDLNLRTEQSKIQKMGDSLLEKEETNLQLIKGMEELNTKYNSIFSELEEEKKSHQITRKQNVVHLQEQEKANEQLSLELQKLRSQLPTSLEYVLHSATNPVGVTHIKAISREELGNTDNIFVFAAGQGGSLFMLQSINAMVSTEDIYLVDFGGALGVEFGKESSVIGVVDWLTSSEVVKGRTAVVSNKGKSLNEMYLLTVTWGDVLARAKKEANGRKIVIALGSVSSLVTRVLLRQMIDEVPCYIFDTAMPLLYPIITVSRLQQEGEINKFNILVGNCKTEVQQQQLEKVADNLAKNNTRPNWIHISEGVIRLKDILKV